jgi:hypothetical protein
MLYDKFAKRKFRLFAVSEVTEQYIFAQVATSMS